MRAWLAIVGLMATPAVAAEQFDLICKAPRAAERYRIDLARGEWCFGDCNLVQKLAEVTSGTIFLRKQEPTSANGPKSINSVNRSSGAWHRYSFNPRYDRAPAVMDGACTPTEFSGFPASKF